MVLSENDLSLPGFAITCMGNAVAYTKGIARYGARIAVQVQAVPDAVSRDNGVPESKRSP